METVTIAARRLWPSRAANHATRMRLLRRALVASSCFALGATRLARAQQDIGHKLLGGLGIDAGVQPEPGLYIAGRVVRYAATQLRDRNGVAVPVNGFDLDAWGGTLGASFVTKPAATYAPYLSFAASAPVARISLNVDDPRVAIDRSGLGDAHVQPIKLGWRLPGFDVVGSYSIYAPTGRFEPRGGSGVGRGFWTQEASLGAASFWSTDRSRRISLLASYDVNSRKRGIDLTRGNTLQVQGGAGAPVTKTLTVGAAWYALWQVSADRGTALPIMIRGQRDRVFGLGPEVQLTLPAAGVRAEGRIEFEFGVRSRPCGDVAAGGVTYWRH